MTKTKKEIIEMSFNPFDEKPEKVEKGICDFAKMYPKNYDKDSTDPYTKTRVILMNGTEFESVYGGHNFSRNCPDNDLRRDLALIRKVEQIQQKRISALKPINETILETTIGYEQLAVDLTAIMAEVEKDPVVKKALDFALLEDFDHLYRYANLLDMDDGIHAERLVGEYTEITPGRPTVAEHRHPYDELSYWIDNKTADPLTKLHACIITAAEQQTMNYYMNVGGFYKNDLGRKLYSEIAMIEEQHVTRYGGLKDPTLTYLENCLNHEYTECYLYYSCLQDESDPEIRKVWELHLTQEIAHLHKVAELLKKYEKRDWQEVITKPAFPKLLHFKPNKEYVRKVIAETINDTAELEEYVDACKYSADRYPNIQKIMNKNIEETPSHAVISTYITKFGKDYRYEDTPNPCKELQNRSVDNTDVGRCIKN